MGGSATVEDYRLAQSVYFQQEQHFSVKELSSSS
jgi:hypothetical protein